MFKTQITRASGLCALTVIIIVQLCITPGCHRGYYRRQSDVVAQRLVLEKSNDPRWNTSDGTIDINPASRMFDPFSADHPPIPPDDAASHQFMHRVNGHPGYPHWHANGDTNWVENPEWRSYLPVNEYDEVVINFDRAYQLALIHSTDFQQQREALYLSALNVSLERFGFDSQLFSGFNSLFNTQGNLAPGGSSSTLENSLGENGEGINWQKLGITGTTFAVGLANSIIWNFAGSDTQTASSLIDFSIVQPLLRNAGREFILEQLTQAERTLLANVRQMDRFRRGYFLEIATGRNAASPVSPGFLGQPAGGNGNAGGLLGLIEQQQNIRIQEFNVVQQEASLEKFREFFARDRLDNLQVAQLENSVYSAQQALLQTRNGFENSLDFFKRSLGLPPNLNIIIEDPYLEQFELLSDEITSRQNTIDRIRVSAGEAIGEIDDLLPDNADEIEGFEFDFDAIDTKVSALAPFLEEAKRLLEGARTDDVDLLKADIAKMSSVRDDRLQYLADLRAGISSGQIRSDVDPGLLAAESIPEPKDLQDKLNGIPEERWDKMNQALVDAGEEAIEDRPLGIKEKLALFEIQLKTLTKRVADFSQDREEMDNLDLYIYLDGDIMGEIANQLTEFSNSVLELTLLQAEARSNSIEIAKVDLTSETATKIARCFRRDWMNARAGLVDEFRQIEFFADQLEADFELFVDGSVGNFGDNPFRIRFETGQLSGGFRFDSPIVRLSERNQYRQALIDYQQAKRAFYEFEDQVSLILRQTIRSINVNQIIFELQRRQVQVQIRQVEQSRLRLEQPTRGPAALGSTTARDLTDALNGLQGAQSAFLAAWVSFEVLRRDLDFDMGTMQIDENGVWIDPGEMDWTIAERAANRMGIQLDCQFCDQVHCPPESAGSQDSSEFSINGADPSDPGQTDPGQTDPGQSENGEKIYSSPEFKPSDPSTPEIGPEPDTPTQLPWEPNTPGTPDRPGVEQNPFQGSRVQPSRAAREKFAAKMESNPSHPSVRLNEMRIKNNTQLSTAIGRERLASQIRVLEKQLQDLQESMKMSPLPLANGEPRQPSLPREALRTSLQSSMQQPPTVRARQIQPQPVRQVHQTQQTQQTTWQPPTPKAQSQEIRLVSSEMEPNRPTLANGTRNPNLGTVTTAAFQSNANTANATNATSKQALMPNQQNRMQNDLWQKNDLWQNDLRQSSPHTSKPASIENQRIEKREQLRQQPTQPPMTNSQKTAPTAQPYQPGSLGTQSRKPLFRLSPLKTPERQIQPGPTSPQTMPALNNITQPVDQSVSPQSGLMNSSFLKRLNSK